jgi:hypothetical protein
MAAEGTQRQERREMDTFTELDWARASADYHVVDWQLVGPAHGAARQPPVALEGVLDRVFLGHPRSLGETYWQHQRRALRFGGSMVAAGIACLVHAVIPAVFVRTASTMVLRLHEQMHAARRLKD